MKTCENCLFYVDAMPDEVICVAGKKTKSYAMMKTNCKRWVDRDIKDGYWGGDPVDVCVEMIVKLKKKGLI